MVIRINSILSQCVKILFVLYFFLSPVCAEIGTAPQNMQLRASIEDIPMSCKIGFDGDKGNYVNFGRITPSQINNAPVAGTQSVSDIFSTSNFNNVYDSKEPLAILTISCDGENEVAADSIKIQYGTSGQKVILSQYINGFLIDSGPNQPFLGFALYGRDKNSSMEGKLDRYIEPGLSSPLEADSFVTKDGTSSASILLYPALYWRDTNDKNTAPGVITTSIDFVVTLV